MGDAILSSKCDGYEDQVASKPRACRSHSLWLLGNRHAGNHLNGLPCAGLSSSKALQGGLALGLHETLLQGMVQHAPRLVPSQTASSPAPFQLLPKPRGALQNLVPEPLQTDLAGNEVLVEVHAVGVNFRDVLNVLGMYPGDPGPPGADCAGVVVARGSAVRQLDIGTHRRCKLPTLPHD